MKQRRIKTYLAVGVLCAVVIGAFGVYCAVLATRPDRELTFVRDVPTHLPIATLTQSIGVISNWPDWFFNAGKVERVDPLGRAFPSTDQIVVKGALIRVEILPHKGEHRGSFDILLRITEYIPGQMLRADIMKDQSRRINQLFDRLAWTIEILPGNTSDGSSFVLRGTELAHTRHWRSRVFAGLSQRILMNQVFYPDLMALGQFTQPRSQNPYPSYGQ